MAASNDPNLNLYYGWDPRESGWNTGMDANLKKLGAVVHLSVISMETDIPGSPANGDRYIVPSGATGDWSGHDGQVAVRVAGAWEFYSPARGWRAWVEDENAEAVRNASAWELITRPQWVDPPASASAAGTPGQMAYESGYLYICIAIDTWQRAAVATWS